MAIKKKIATAIFVLDKLKESFPETKTLIIHENNDIDVNKIKIACLLKSRKSPVKGRKKMGIKATKTYKLYFETTSQIFDNDRKFFSIYIKNKKE
jgi:hypothetical protein